MTPDCCVMKRSGGLLRPHVYAVPRHHQEPSSGLGRGRVLLYVFSNSYSAAICMPVERSHRRGIAVWFRHTLAAAGSEVLAMLKERHKTQTHE